MRQMAERFASEGFLVLVPDLYWRQEPGLALNDDPGHPLPEETARAMSLNARFNDEAAIVDIQACLDWIRARAEGSGHVGVLGYCLGGRLAFLSAIRTNADANVGYHGVDIRRYISEADRLRSPLLLHFAGNDQLCDENERLGIIQALSSIEKSIACVHGGAGHQFALPGAPHYDALVASFADTLSIQFLQSHLNDK